MIIIDTGPLVSLFDPKDQDHEACHTVLKEINEPLFSTEAVLTEVLHMLAAGSKGAEGVKEFFLADYVSLSPLTKADLNRCFELMDAYGDLPMDFADATLMALAETLKTAKVFTLDLNDFSVYRYKKGHRHYPLDLIGRDVVLNPAGI